MEAVLSSLLGTSGELLCQVPRAAAQRQGSGSGAGVGQQARWGGRQLGGEAGAQ